MFQIATEVVTARKHDGRVTFKGHAVRADRKKRQIVSAIEACETAKEVEDILTIEGEVMDALDLDYPEFSEEIREAADDHKAVLAHCAPEAGAPAAMTPTAQTKKT